MKKLTAIIYTLIENEVPILPKHLTVLLQDYKPKTLLSRRKKKPLIKLNETS